LPNLIRAAENADIVSDLHWAVMGLIFIPTLLALLGAFCEGDLNDPIE